MPFALLARRWRRLSLAVLFLVLARWRRVLRRGALGARWTFVAAWALFATGALVMVRRTLRRGVADIDDADVLFQPTILVEVREKAVEARRVNLNVGFALLDFNRADLAFVDAAGFADHRNEPARFGLLGAAD
jgi:hypothetical protein